MLRNPQQIIFPQNSSKMALAKTILLKASRMWLCTFLWASGHFSSFPVHLSLRAHRSCCKVSSWDLSSISERGGYAHEDQNAAKHVGMDHFLPEFLRDVMHLLRIARCAPIPKIVCPSVKPTWILAAPNPETHCLIASKISIRQQNFFHHSFSASCKADCEPLCAWSCTFHPTCIPIEFCILTYGRMPIITWRIRTISIKVIAAWSLISLSRWIAASRKFPFSTNLFLHLVSAVLEQERTIVPSFHVCFSSWRTLQAFPFVHCPFAFHWWQSLCFFSTKTFFPIRVITNTPVSILSFLPWKFRVLIFWSKCLFTMVFNFW